MMRSYCHFTVPTDIGGALRQVISAKIVSIVQQHTVNDGCKGMNWSRTRVFDLICNFVSTTSGNAKGKFLRPRGNYMNVSARALLFAMGAAAFAAPAFAQTPAPQQDAEVVVVTGTRVASRSALDTAAPVDVVSSAQLAQQGSTE